MDEFFNNLLAFLCLSAFNTILSLALPLKLFNPGKWLFRIRQWEDYGMVYQRLFRIRKWKNSLPELSDFVKSAFHKKKLKTFDSCYLEAFVVESCRAELTHESIIATTFLFSWWAAPSVFMAIFNIALLLNVPFIMIQRYNRPRILRMLAQNKRFVAEIKTEDVPIS